MGVSNERGSVLFEAVATIGFLLAFFVGATDLLFISYQSVMSQFLTTSVVREVAKTGLTDEISQIAQSKGSSLLIDLNPENVCACALDDPDACLDLEWSGTEACGDSLTSNTPGNLFVVAVRYPYSAVFGLFKLSISATAIGRYEPSKI